MDELKAKRIALLATHGVEGDQVRETRQALEEAGAAVEVVAPRSGTIRAWANDDWSDPIKVERSLRGIDEMRYDALLLPGGVLHADALRGNKDAVAFVRTFFAGHKPVAALGHGVQVLIAADVVRDRTLTSPEAVRKDAENAGARWSEEGVVVDEGLVTGGSAADLPGFKRKLVEEVWEGRHTRQTL